jgi:hypothetical protein
LPRCRRTGVNLDFEVCLIDDLLQMGTSRAHPPTALAATDCGIAVSGFGTEQDQKRSREAGYESHLTKPVAVKPLPFEPGRSPLARQAHSSLARLAAWQSNAC